MKAGVIGLGAIGGGVAQCLARAGLLSAVYDIRPDALAKLPNMPPLSDSPADLASRCEVVLIAVVSGKQARAVLEGPNGVLSRARPGMYVVLLSTVSLDDLAGLRELTDGAATPLVDCGVTGGGKAAENGLTCLVGADNDALAAVRPILDGFAKLVVVMGKPGAGMAAKIARNVIVFGAWRAGYEGTMLAKAAGVDLQRLFEVVRSSAEAVGGPLNMMERPSDPLKDPVERDFREYVRNLMIKDLDAALDLATSLGRKLPLIELARRTDRELIGLEGI
jgi:3-hydroxyisobutyrate dehydrogenase